MGSADQLEVGEVAPDFQLPGVDRGSFAMFDLHRVIDRNQSALLVFFPTDFLKLPTDTFVAMRRYGWTSRTSLAVWGLGGDSIFAHHRYAEDHGLDLPLVSDFHAGVARQYGLAIDDWEGHGPTPSWAWVFIDSDWVVRRVWADPPTPTWRTPPIGEFVETVAEYTGIHLETLDIKPP